MPVILNLLKHPDARIRASALSSLERMKPPGYEDLMLHALRDPDPTVRTAAISGLGEVESRDVVKPLLQITRKKLQPEERQAVFNALWKLSTQGSTAKKSPRKRVPPS